MFPVAAGAPCRTEDRLPVLLHLKGKKTKTPRPLRECEGPGRFLRTAGAAKFTVCNSSFQIPDFGISVFRYPLNY